MLVACCHECFHCFCFKEHVWLKQQNCANYGKLLAYSIGFLSKGKLETKLLLSFLSSNCCQREDYAQIIGLSKGYCSSCHAQSNKSLSLKLHLQQDQYIKHSSICPGNTRSQLFTWKMILHNYSQKNTLEKYSLPFMIQ